MRTWMTDGRPIAALRWITICSPTQDRAVPDVVDPRSSSVELPSREMGPTLGGGTLVPGVWSLRTTSPGVLADPVREPRRGDEAFASKAARLHLVDGREVLGADRR